MPRSAPSACIEPMCPELCESGTRCATHRREVKHQYRDSPERRKLNTFYSGLQWRSLSKAFRRRHPLCAHCMSQGITKPCAMVDHVTPIRVDWELRYTSSNLQALCNGCHAIKTARDRS